MKLIEMEKVLSELCLSHKDIIYIDKNETAERIRKIPSIDIVRCDECQYYEDGHCESAEMWQSISGYITECGDMNRNADDFCSYGWKQRG